MPDAEDAVAGMTSHRPRSGFSRVAAAFLGHAVEPCRHCMAVGDDGRIF